MKKKNLISIIFALGIVAVLTISFFWGGTDEVVPLANEELQQDLAVINEINSIGDVETIQDNENRNNQDVEKEDEPKAEIEKTEDERPNEEAKGNERVIEQSPKTTPQKSQEQRTDKQSKTNNAEKQTKTAPENTNVTTTEQQKEEKEKIIAEDNKNTAQQDQYLTDPVPEGKPKPVEWQDTSIEKDKQLTASLAVTAKTILNNMDLFNKDKLEVLPEDGVIFPKQTVTFYQGESVFDVLLREMQANKIHMEFVMTPIYNSHYIEGINNLYEFDCGELSGWMYKVNDWFPNYGASRYQLEDGDVIEWIYTCDLGRDIGGAGQFQGGGR